MFLGGICCVFSGYSAQVNHETPIKDLYEDNFLALFHRGLLRMVDGNLSRGTDSSTVDVVTVEMAEFKINHLSQKYPHCVVWTPIPLLTWLFPVIGHMGIGMSSGIIRDFAGPYHVGTDDMAFGKPTKYWQMDPRLAVGGVEGWDKAITEASEIYKNRNHNLFFDNCHSHVAMALNKMNYKSSCSWNMVKLAFLILCHGKYVGFVGFLKTWLPFIVLISTVIVLVCAT